MCIRDRSTGTWPKDMAPVVRSLLIGGAWLLATGFGITYRVYPFWRDSPRLFGCWGVFFAANMLASRWKNGLLTSGLVLIGTPFIAWFSSIAWKMVCIAADPTSLVGAVFWAVTLAVLLAGRSSLRRMINQLRWHLNRHRFEADFQAAAALDLTGGRGPSVLLSPSEDPEITAAKLNSLLTAGYVPELSPSPDLNIDQTDSLMDQELLTTKRRDVQRQIAHVHGKKLPNQVVQLTVDRDRLVAHSLEALRQFPVSDLARNRLEVRFQHEYADDLGGVTRDWMDSLGRAVTREMISAEGSVPLSPLPLSDLTGNEALDLVTIGRLMALCLLHANHMRISLHPVIYKLVVGSVVTTRDLFRETDGFYDTFVAQIIHGSAESISAAASIVGEETLHFVSPFDHRPMHPAGSETVVIPQNAAEYVAALNALQADSLASRETGLLLSGFWEVIPQGVLQAAQLSGPELAELITGQQNIDVLDWRAHTEYTGFSECSSQVEWFWEIMTNCDNAFRMEVLQFATGSGSLPICGSQMLQPKFHISRDPTASHLPQAHACANQLMLPECESLEELSTKLGLACKHGCGFGFI
eukprot:TRINITY_DN24554_c0_g1_i1.p1 TRINITY_DN24554_c0_g1~~TRINITY_DN24554_c0_g1_i1.p1  ORF type:complete len:583 (+),score=105.35 TRINITY_DN24554_c0_g1_i1:165-1913(+)